MLEVVVNAMLKGFPVGNQYLFTVFLYLLVLFYPGFGNIFIPSDLSILFFFNGVIDIGGIGGLFDFSFYLD